MTKEELYNRGEEIIDSCVSYEQLIVAVRWIELAGRVLGVHKHFMLSQDLNLKANHLV